ncbi:MAG: cytochrome c3 family protein [Bryobacteraceae bacterium]
MRGLGKAAGNDCARCHSEHNGSNHALIRWSRPPERFDHREAGWALEGRHARLECRQCHQEARITEADRAVLRRTNLSQSYAGLESRCTACHRDEHRGDLGQDCQRCHTAEAWKPAPGFSHSVARYPLTGRHQQVACGKCHKPIAALGSHAQYRNFVQYEACRSCHADPHGGSFAGGCERCHTTEGWKGTRIAGQFDHSRTDFPLRGKHAAVP